MSPVALHKDVYPRMSHNAYFHLRFRLDINCSGFIPFLQCSVCTVCTLQACFHGLMDAQSPWRSSSSSQHHIPSQLTEEICVIYLVVQKLFIFYFTVSLKYCLEFTFKWELTLFSISPVSYSHDYKKVRVAPILLCIRHEET